MTVIDAPNLELNIPDLVDWLELVALFSEYGVSRLDVLTSALDQLSEVEEEDIGLADQNVEDLINRIESEIEVRVNHLGVTYPFALSSDAEELQLVGDLNDVQSCFYLVCLVTSHVTKSPILRRPPEGVLLNSLRNQIFQILSTLAMAGLVQGSAVTVGWPRQRGETVQQLMRRAAGGGAGFDVRDPIGIYVSPSEKDGGVDVIAWTGEISPPPSNLFFGQTASGNNWENKPVKDQADMFESNYLQDVMVGNRGYATIIPFRVHDQSTWMTQSKKHKTLIDRLRLPPHAVRGLQSASSGFMVDEADRSTEIINWLHSYRNAALS